MSNREPDGISALLALGRPPGTPELGEAYLEMVEGLRHFLDAVAGAHVDVGEARELGAVLEQWTAMLRQREVGERDRVWGRWVQTPGRGQALIPEAYDESVDGCTFTAKVAFGRYHVGENMAAHGGAISLLFDDILGWLMMLATNDAGVRFAPSRTAYLTTNYRSVTPVGEELELRGRIERVEGRKRFVSGELLHKGSLCADAEGLWIELLPGHR